MKIVIKMFIFTILAMGTAVLGKHPGSYSAALYSREDSFSSHGSDDSLDRLLDDLVDQRVDDIDFSDDYLTQDGDSLDGLFDQVRGGELVEEQLYRSDSLDDLLATQSAQRYKKEDLPALEKTYRDLIFKREALASEKSDLERKCEESDCETCCEIDDLAEKIDNMTNSIGRMRSTITYLKKLRTL